MGKTGGKGSEDTKGPKGTARNAYKSPLVLGEVEDTTPTQHNLPKKQCAAYCSFSRA